MDFIELYTSILIVAVVVMMPVAVAAAVFLWRVHAEDRRLDTRIPPPRVRLSLVLAITGTIAAIAEVWFTFIVAYRALSGPTPAAWIPITATIVVMLAFAPLLKAGYLWSLRRSRGRNGKASPPPFGAED